MIVTPIATHTISTPLRYSVEPLAAIGDPGNGRATLDVPLAAVLPVP